MGVNTTKSRETFATALVCLIAGVGRQPIHTPSSSQIQVPSETPSVTQSRGPFDYIVIILMENKNYADIVGNPMAPYINRLARDYGINSNYYDVSRNGSLHNYLGVTTSQTYHSWTTCNQPTSKCPGFVPVSSRTIIDSVEHAGLTWKAYMEDAPSNCYQYDSGLYAVRHDPFVYFARVQNSMLECNRVV